MSHVTDPKLAEKALRESKERFRALITATSDIVYRMSPDWSEMRQLQGKKFIPTTEKPNLNWLQEYIPPSDQPQVIAAINEAIRTKSIFELEHRVYRVDGTVGWTFSRAIPILDEKGSVTEWFGAASDITDRKLAEMELAANLEKLKVETVERARAVEALREKEHLLIQQSRQAALGEMISYIAHQWRQPLNSLGLTIQGIKYSYDYGELTGELISKSVATSMKLVEHMAKTIDDFRNYFKLEKEKKRFDVKEAVDMALDLVSDGFNYKSISVEIHNKCKTYIYGYRNEFIQVLINIFNNASDALTESDIEYPKITITVDSEKEHSIVTITDNGGGIPKEIINKIFDPYFTSKDSKHGTGVGLYMSKTIIEKHMGGKISARNVAQGAEFRIEL